MIVEATAPPVRRDDVWRSLLHEMTQWRIDFERSLEHASTNKSVIVWHDANAKAWRAQYARNTLLRQYGQPLRLWVPQTMLDTDFSLIIRSLCQDMVACLIHDEVARSKRLSEVFTAAVDDQAMLTLRFG